MSERRTDDGHAGGPLAPEPREGAHLAAPLLLLFHEAAFVQRWRSGVGGAVERDPDHGAAYQHSVRSARHEIGTGLRWARQSVEVHVSEKRTADAFNTKGHGLVRTMVTRRKGECLA
jgi:hypothetical protein